MENLLYKYAHTSEIHLTYLLLHTFIDIAEKRQDLSVIEVAEVCLTSCGVEKFSPEDVAVIVEKISFHIENSSSKSSPKKTPKKSKGKNFGEDYHEWLKELKIDQQLLIISDYNYSKAKEYYTKVPIDVVDSMLELRFKSDWLEKQAMLEACVVGFGGSLGNSAPAQELSMDSQESAKALATAAKQMGF